MAAAGTRGGEKPTDIRGRVATRDYDFFFILMYLFLKIKLPIVVVTNKLRMLVENTLKLRLVLVNQKLVLL